MRHISVEGLNADRLSSEPAYRVLADRIIAQILAGTIKPGEMLPREIDLAEQFGVHRSTVREGIRLLEETGMLRRKSAKRLVVSVPDGGQLAARSAQALIMRRVTVRHIYEANHAFDPVMARIAAERASDAQIRRLKRNIEDMTAAEPDDLQALDAEFHSLVTEATNNIVLPIARQPLQDLFIPMVAKLIHSVDTRERMMEAHRYIVTAIDSRDPAMAELWMRRHMEDFKRGFLKAGFDFDAPVSMDGELQT